MTTIETTTVVGPDRKLTVQLPPDVAPGAHRVRIVVDDPGAAKMRSRLDDFPTIDLGPWPQFESLRRESLYGDDGR